MIVSSGHPLICIKGGTCFCKCTKVIEGAMYFCDGFDPEPTAHAWFCDIDNCAGVTVYVLDKDHGFCADRFRPLDPEDTSLVENEVEDYLPGDRVNV